MKVFVATANAGKLRELRALCEPHGWELATFPGYREPLEGELSYEANAVLKARALYDQLREAQEPFEAVIGDDSGIEVAALGGRPGVLSARYGGPDATWEERRQLLVSELDRVRDELRAARFVCVVHLIDATLRRCTAEGFVEGCIVREERGDGGFSYDAVFEYPAAERTFAELSFEEKNRVSHRAVAIERLVQAVNGWVPRG